MKQRPMVFETTALATDLRRGAVMSFSDSSRARQVPLNSKPVSLFSFLGRLQTTGPVIHEAPHSDMSYGQNSLCNTDSIPIPMTATKIPLPSKIPQIPCNRDHKALNRATLGVYNMSNVYPRLNRNQSGQES